MERTGGAGKNDGGITGVSASTANAGADGSVEAASHRALVPPVEAKSKL